MPLNSLITRRAVGARRLRIAVAGVLATLAAEPLRAQTSYYNTDRGRPFSVQDATPVERFGLDIQLSPIRGSLAVGAKSEYEAEPSIGWGALPQTQVELGLPLSFGGPGNSAVALRGVSLSVLHALNVETTEVPALAILAEVALPAGSGSGRKTRTELGFLATRSLAGAFRVHLNAHVLVAGADRSATSTDERWMAGAAVDKTFPLAGLLVGAETFLRAPSGRNMPSEWTSSVGARRQIAQRWVLDAGVGRTFTGVRQATFASIGLGFSYSWMGPFARGGR